jgi:hypothetical protein
MSTRSVRRGIGQAAWNKQFSETYLWHMLVPAIVVGLVTQSWAVFFICYVGFNLLLDRFEGFRVCVMLFYSVFWAFVVGALAGLLMGLEAGIVFGLFGLMISYENLRSGWQYWNDLA